MDPIRTFGLFINLFAGSGRQTWRWIVFGRVILKSLSSAMSFLLNRYRCACRLFKQMAFFFLSFALTDLNKTVCSRKDCEINRTCLSSHSHRIYDRREDLKCFAFQEVRTDFLTPKSLVRFRENFLTLSTKNRKIPVKMTALSEQPRQHR